MPSVSIRNAIDSPPQYAHGCFHPLMATAAYRRLSPLLRELFGTLPSEKQQFLYKLIQGALRNTKAINCWAIVFESFKTPLLVLQNTVRIVPLEERKLYVIRLEDGWYEWRSMRTDDNTGCVELTILGLVFAIGLGLAMTYCSRFANPCSTTTMIPIADMIRAFH
jgi:hypothetical protein